MKVLRTTAVDIKEKLHKEPSFRVVHANLVLLYTLKSL